MKKIKNLVIVGGGSSGWLTAAYFSNNFPNLNITIIDKEIGTPGGVGEATLLNFSKFLNACGFNVNEWYDELEATDKLGILFPNWIDDNKDISHPFFVSKTSSDEYKKRLKIKLENLANVAYHINCGKLTTFLQKKLNNKIIFKKSDVQKVVFDGDEIKKLILKNGEEITVTYGKNKEILGHFIPKRVEKPKKRILGALEGKMKVIFKEDFGEYEKFIINHLH
jgi:2-polyprenyl-6-methoxyphenol hydroxylase-like FAD-dependent oxidoreductase